MKPIVRSGRFRVTSGKKMDLKKWPTVTKPVYSSKEHYQKLLKGHIGELSGLQEMLYADNRYSLLLVFQAMDAAGKDGAIQHVMSGINPQGCQVYSFKQPSAEELDHDFLWRTGKCLPERGRIGIFNRSYYEEVLVVRVHPKYLEAQGIPASMADRKDFWKGRFRSINDQESHLHRNGTRLLKFYLHLSKEEQRKRFLARIDDPNKNWKFSTADVEERKLWDAYQKAYEACLEATSTKECPWHVVPADDKKNARLIISQIVLDALKGMEMRYPAVDAAKRRELQALRSRL
jgi:PPK2 family polyphosphate:nucleotide phosphotransferase